MSNFGNQRTLQQGPSPAGQLVWGVVSTALLAGWIYWQMGPMAALGGVIGIFVHEYGHVLAINRAGMGPGRIHIIPFLGGAASWRTPPDSEYTGALVALAGPAFGMVAAIPFLVIAKVTGQAMWLEAALFISIINLLNLAPAPPLDGSKVLGPVLARVHPMLERAALLAVGGLAIVWALSRHSYIFAAFVGISIMGSLGRGGIRAPSRPLSGGEQLSLVGLFAATVFMCLVTLQIIADGLGKSSPLDLLANLVRFHA
ncbi:MAG: peptidase [Caulobacter sp.]|nr:peptidase [Caulobacter sp.]